MAEQLWVEQTRDGVVFSPLMGGQLFPVDLRLYGELMAMSDEGGFYPFHLQYHSMDGRYPYPPNVIVRVVE